MPKDGPFAPFVKLQAIEGHAAPVGEIPAGDGRGDFVFCCPDGTGEVGAAAVGSHRNGGALRYSRPARAIAAADAGYVISVACVFLGCESVPQLNTRLKRAIDEQVIERNAPRAVARRNATDHQIATHKREWSCVPSDRRD